MEMTIPVPRAEILPLVRDGLLPVTVILAAALFPPALTIALFLIVGQGHFFMTFIYQGKARKMLRPRYALSALACVALALAYFNLVGNAELIFVVAGIAFGVHFSIDEFYLHGERLAGLSIMTVAGFFFLYASIIVQVLGPGLSYLPLLAALVVLCGILLRLVAGRLPSPAERYLWLVMLLIAALSLGFGYTVQILGAVILLHCFNWIIGYGQKVNDLPQYRAAYWRDTVLTLALSVSFYAAWAFGGVSWLAALYLPMFWYGWAIVHFVLTSNFVSGVKRPLFA